MHHFQSLASHANAAVISTSTGPVQYNTAQGVPPHPVCFQVQSWTGAELCPLVWQEKNKQNVCSLILQKIKTFLEPVLRTIPDQLQT